MTSSDEGESKRLKEGWGQEYTFSKATAKRENGLNQRPKYKGFLSAVKVGETSEEEKQTARTEGECGNKPLEFIG